MHRTKSPISRTVPRVLFLAICALSFHLANAAVADKSNSNPGGKNSAAPTNWTQFHFFGDHQGVNPYETVLSPATVGGLHVKWRFPLGEASPAVVDGVVFAGVENKLFALNATTGAQIWSYQISSACVGASPVVAAGTVYMATLSRRGVIALNAQTGALRWDSNLQIYCSTPVIDNGVLYVGSTDHHVYALDATTGATLWRYATGNQVIYCSPAVANGTVYIGSTDGSLYALNASTGALVWSFAAGGVESSPAVVNGTVFFGSVNGDVYALDAATGRELWTYTTGLYIYSGPAIANQVVYVGSDDGTFYALDAATGTKRWSYTTGGPITSSPPSPMTWFISGLSTTASTPSTP